MNCQPGDLALVVRSSNPENLMKIVEVIKPYDPAECGIAIAAKSRQIWLCESLGSDLVWSDLVNQPMTRAPRGPIPDECLKPLRPRQESDDSEATRSCTPPTRKAALVN